MKKYYVDLFIPLGWLFIVIISILGFIWEMVDTEQFSFISFLVSVIIPLGMETYVVVVFMQYVQFDNEGIKKYLFGKLLYQATWDNIKEIRLEYWLVFISQDYLIGPRSQWRKKTYIYIVHSDHVIEIIKKYMNKDTKNNFY